MIDDHVIHEHHPYRVYSYGTRYTVLYGTRTSPERIGPSGVVEKLSARTRGPAFSPSDSPSRQVMGSHPTSEHAFA